MKMEGQPGAAASNPIQAPVRFRSVIEEHIWALVSNRPVDGVCYDPESRCRYFLVRGQLMPDGSFAPASGSQLSLPEQSLLHEAAGAILCLKDDGVLEVEYYGTSEQQFLENVWSDLTADIAEHNERC